MKRHAIPVWDEICLCKYSDDQMPSWRDINSNCVLHVIVDFSLRERDARQSLRDLTSYGVATFCPNGLSFCLSTHLQNDSGIHTVKLTISVTQIERTMQNLS